MCTNKFNKNEIQLTRPMEIIKLPVPADFINKSIGELMQEENTDVVIRNGSISMRKVDSDGVITASYTKFSNGGAEVKATSNPHQLEKKDNLPYIKEMLKGGKTQKEVAYELGMSPSYVSKLLKK